MYHFIKYWHYFNLSNIDNKEMFLLEDIDSSISFLEIIKQKIPSELTKDNIRSVHEILLQFLKSLKEEEEKLFRAEKYLQNHDLELLSKLEEEKEFLLKAQEDMQNYEIIKDIHLLRKLSAKIKTDIEKLQKEIQSIENKGEKDFYKYSKLMGLHHLARQLFIKESAISQEVKEEEKMLSKSETSIKNQENEDLERSFNLFFHVSTREANDLFTAEHDGFLLIFDIISELDSTNQIIKKIKNTKMYVITDEMLIKNYNILKKEIDKNILNLKEFKKNYIKFKKN